MGRVGAVRAVGAPVAVALRSPHYAVLEPEEGALARGHGGGGGGGLLEVGVGGRVVGQRARRGVVQLGLAVERVGRLLLLDVGRRGQGVLLLAWKTTTLLSGDKK